MNAYEDNQAVEPIRAKEQATVGRKGEAVQRGLKWVGELALMALIIFGGRSVLADWNHIPSGSMEPTLLIGDLILVNRLAYDLKVPFTHLRLSRWGDPERGDIVVFDSPGDGRLLIKRVIGLPGEWVAMRENVLYIDGREVAYKPLAQEIGAALVKQEQRAHAFAAEELPGQPHPVMVSRIPSPMANFLPVEVPDGHYLVLGDNRDNSADSRFFGFVPRENILGRATKVILSWNPNRYYLPRGGRFLADLQ